MEIEDDKKIILPLNKRNLHIWYHPAFSRYLEDNVSYRYRLYHGKDELNFRSVGKDTYLAFQYLPPGENTLEIQALKNNQVVDTK